MPRHRGVSAELSLKDLMFREDARVHRELDRHLRGVREIVSRRYGDSQPMRQVMMEMETILAFPQDRAGLVCKRAALLFALREPEVAKYFDDLDGQTRKSDGPRGFALDMAKRVLPLTAPLFIRNGCQAPDAFLILSLILSQMWQGEQLGNWHAR